MVAEYPVLEGYADEIRRSIREHINEELESEKIALQQTLAKKNVLLKEKSEYAAELEAALAAERKRTADLMEEKTKSFKEALAKMTVKKNEEIGTLKAKVETLMQSKNVTIIKKLKENNLTLMGAVAELDRRLKKEEENNNVLAKEGDRVYRLWLGQGELIAHLENQVNDLRKVLHDQGGHEVMLDQQARLIDLEAEVNELNADLVKQKGQTELQARVIRALQSQLTDEQIKIIRDLY